MRRATVGLLLAIAILLRSAWDATPRLQANWHLWSRLRQAHRGAPDTTWDRYYAELIPYLPPRSAVGLVQLALPGTSKREREYYFLQYSLTPRLVDPSASPAFVVVTPPAAAASRLDPTEYAAVKAFADDFALYRRTRE